MNMRNKLMMILMMFTVLTSGCVWDAEKWEEPITTRTTDVEEITDYEWASWFLKWITWDDLKKLKDPESLAWWIKVFIIADAGPTEDDI